MRAGTLRNALMRCCPRRTREEAKVNSSPSLSDRLAAQNEGLRRTFEQIIDETAPGTEGAALLRVVAEGLLAIYERQRTAVLITAQIP